MRVSILLAMSVLTVLVACAPRRGGPPATPRTHQVIDTVALREHSRFLASDLLLGRGTATAGAEIAALYIAGACGQLGLHPVGGRFAHPVALELVEVDSDAARLTVTQGGDSTSFTVGQDFLFVGGNRAAMRAFRGTPVWVGSGGEILASPERLPALTGVVALTAGPIRAPAARVLAARGAAAAVHLLPDAETFQRYAASRSRDLMAVADSAAVSSFFPTIPSILAAPAAGNALLSSARNAGAVQLEVRARRRPITSDNLACMLPGADRSLADTAIAFTAHYDHLGVSVPDADGDSIYNGFSDNAAGVAMLLAIARAAADTSAPPFRHSLLFLFFTGEERGLLGSDFFVARPPYPLERIRAVINLDAGAPPARPWTWRIAGGDSIPLGALAMDVAASRGWSATTSAATPNSDYYPFARMGIPAVFIIPGSAPYEGLSADSSQALRRRWDRYHQAGDEWHDDFPFAGLQRYAEYALLLARAVDRAPERAGGAGR